MKGYTFGKLKGSSYFQDEGVFSKKKEKKPISKLNPITNQGIEEGHAWQDREPANYEVLQDLT